MNYIVADDALLDRLQGILVPVEIRDSSGKALGCYTPNVSPEVRAAYARAANLFDLEEADRVARMEQGGYTIDEVMKHLQSLGKAE